MKLLAYILLLVPLFAAQAATQIKVSNNNDQPVSQIVVYLTSLDGQTHPHNSKNIQINQKDKAFIPYITVGQTNNNVNFKNEDDITHHIYSAVGNNKFSFKIKAGEEINEHHFSNPGVIPMGCNIHDWMGGYLLLVDTPLFAITDKQGYATFEQELTGRFQLNIWHPQLQTKNNQQQQNINLNNNTPFSVTLTSTLDTIPEQSNDDDFDFLSDYE